MKYTFSDIDARITAYENRLCELKTAFLEGVALDTGITVVRMVDVVQNLGRFEPSWVAVKIFMDVSCSGIGRSE